MTFSWTLIESVGSSLANYRRKPLPVSDLSIDSIGDRQLYFRPHTLVHISATKNSLVVAIEIPLLHPYH
jgi:hypothetical protein